MSYRIDHAAVRELARELGIRQPVRVERRRLGRWVLGDQALCLRRGHLVRVSTALHPERAAAVLAHELCHAYDAERAGLAGWVRLRHAEARDYARYDDYPSELRANQAGAVLGPLVRARCLRERP